MGSRVNKKDLGLKIAGAAGDSAQRAGRSSRDGRSFEEERT
jgi:hypothetical protein